MQNIKPNQYRENQPFLKTKLVFNLPKHRTCFRFACLRCALYALRKLRDFFCGATEQPSPPFSTESAPTSSSKAMDRWRWVVFRSAHSPLRSLVREETMRTIPAQTYPERRKLAMGVRWKLYCASWLLVYAKYIKNTSHVDCDVFCVFQWAPITILPPLPTHQQRPCTSPLRPPTHPLAPPHLGGPTVSKITVPKTHY